MDKKLKKNTYYKKLLIYLNYIDAMFAIIEKTKDNVLLLNLKNDSQLFTTVKNRIGKQTYILLENITKNDLLNKQIYKPGRYLVKNGEKYTLYDKTETVNTGYIYNSSDYNITKISTWYLAVGDVYLELLTDIDDDEKKYMFLDYCGNCTDSIKYEKIKNFIKEGVDPNIRGGSGNTSLMLAIKSSSEYKLKICKRLIKAGCDVNAQSHFLSTPLIEAVRNCDTELTRGVVKLLLEHGADLNLQDSDGWTALIHASGYCSSISSIEFVKQLINAGADLNIKDNEGWTALMYSIRYCNSGSSFECVKMLIDAGADIHHKNSHDYVCLMHAVGNCKGESSIECVDILLNKGVDVNAIDCVGNNALMHAIENIETTSSVECIKKLLNTGSKINIQNSSSMSPLMVACEKCNKENCDILFECIKLLLDNGADVTTPSNNGKTALMYLKTDFDTYLDYYKKYGAIINLL